MTNPTIPQRVLFPGLVGKPVVATFDREQASSDGGEMSRALLVFELMWSEWQLLPRSCDRTGDANRKGDCPPMGKHDRRETSGQPPDSRPVTIQVPLPVLGVVHGVREAFHGLCIATGLQVLEAMMEADRAVLCGPKGRHQVERPAWRGGSVESPVTLGGRQVEVPRLRVRSADGEVPLVSFQWAAVTGPLDEHTLVAVAAGVSTRRYIDTLDPVPAD